MRNSLRLLFVAALVALPCPTMAEVVEYEFTGKVFTGSFQPVFEIYAHNGDPVTGLFSYDTDATPVINSPTWATFPTPSTLGFTFTIQGRVIEANEVRIDIHNNNIGSPVDNFRMGSSSLLVDGQERTGSAGLYLGSRNSDAIQTHLRLPNRLH